MAARAASKLARARPTSTKAHNPGSSRTSTKSKSPAQRSPRNGNTVSRKSLGSVSEYSGRKTVTIKRGSKIYTMPVDKNGYVPKDYLIGEMSKPSKYVRSGRTKRDPTRDKMYVNRNIINGPIIPAKAATYLGDPSRYDIPGVDMPDNNIRSPSKRQTSSGATRSRGGAGSKKTRDAHR